MCSIIKRNCEVCVCLCECRIKIQNLTLLNFAGLVFAPTAGNNSVICQHFTGDHVLQIAYIVQAARLWTPISIQTWSRQLNIYGLGHIFTPSTLTLFIHTTYNMLNIIIYLYRVDTLCLGTFSCWRFFRFYVMFVVYLIRSINVILTHGGVTWGTTCHAFNLKFKYHDL